ncbi:MAG: class II glutamine amidotransferase [Planctomycetes bacterium]|nr:class II glutamine amidotransferase [Planctomycetota bacterium]
MCRWIAYSGPPLYMEELVLKPEHSLIDQSSAARLGKTTTNADGFGVGWYGKRPAPGVYRNVHPAWNDPNLRDLVGHIKSRLFLAHIRAATSTPVQTTNCHPFRHGRWLFVHNGLISDFHGLKRDLALAVAPELYPCIEGSTDTELMFFLALTFGLEDDPLRAVERMAALIEQVAGTHGVQHVLQMTLGISDGERLIGVRYSTERASRSLFLNRDAEALCELHPQGIRFFHGAKCIVSEPLSNLTDCWQEIPESTAVVIEAGEVRTLDFAPSER